MVYACVLVHWVSVSLLLLSAIPMGPCLWHLGDTVLFCEEKAPGCLVIPKWSKDAFVLGPYSHSAAVKLPADSGKRH